ncbi:BQ5605_C001g00710 [Microbotryum silenes-dioicae]|uniref:BQ5605_C001g00710 protein n=1 Tax=Microbotryum silenes-dioicae TaxID=796604 RepID=A0A2X0M441_9BASI|nr:BQ5605_C001g00710 [Microbotryum silenes-dioicae]
MLCSVSVAAGRTERGSALSRFRRNGICNGGNDGADGKYSLEDWNSDKNSGLSGAK